MMEQLLYRKNKERMVHSMKRLIVSILAVLFTVCISTSAMAASSNSTDEQREGVNAMFATETITSGIRNTIDMEQLSSFFDGEEVQIDFDNLLPVYMPINTVEHVDRYQGLLEFTNSYMAPVYAENNTLLGTVKLLLHENKWVVGIFYDGYDIASKIDSLNIPDTMNSMFVENPSNNEFAVLTYSQIDESYYSLDSVSRRGITGNTMIEETALENSAHLIENFDGGGQAEPIIINAVSIFIVISAVGSLLLLVHKYKKRGLRK